VQGLESSFAQIAALAGTLVAPLVYEYLSGYIISLAGVLSLAGLAVAGPILYKVWNDLRKGWTPEEPAVVLGAEATTVSVDTHD
jgi:hypothetical protein